MFSLDLEKYLHRIYRKDEFIKAFNKALESLIDKINLIIIRLESLLHFNRLDQEGCIWWERLLGIEKISSELSNRQFAIRSKFLIRVHNDIILLQNICDAWKRGETIVSFPDGKIKIQFIGEYGIPDDLQSLVNSLNEVKPAHLAFFFIFRYLLVGEIHKQKTIEQMQSLTIGQFMEGRE